MSIFWKDYEVELVDSQDEPIVLEKIERAFRVCYKSEEKMRNESYMDRVNFVKNNIKNGHTSPLEHAGVTVKCTIDRGILAEITRHRVGSAYSVSSTRYIKYNDSVPCILPSLLRMDENAEDREIFVSGIEMACACYQNLLSRNVPPQVARGLLPQSLAVEIIETHNMREWLYIFDLRYFGTTGNPHPDMRYFMHKIYSIFSKIYPSIFSRKPIQEMEDFVNTYKNYVYDLGMNECAF